MRTHVLSAALAFVLIAGPSAFAQEPTPSQAVARPDAGAGELPSLDSLFAQLKRERNERAAERIARRIQEEWLKSGSASIDLLMQWSQDAMQAQEYGVALDFLDRVTVLQPDFAEGWNRRATVHFMMRDFRQSMRDIERTLRLEPRHFGALSGMGQILKETGREELALGAYQRVLDVYPMMRSAQNEFASLSEDLAGQAL